MSDVLILIPAAGASLRMRGRDKLLEDVAGRPVLALVAARALATGQPVMVTLPPDRPRRAEALEALADGRLNVVEIAEAREGMAASIRAASVLAGARADLRGMMVVPADMPELETADFQSVMACFSRDPDRVARGYGADGTPGHPVVFPRRLFGPLARLEGDRGARDLLRGEAVQRVTLPDRHALTDLDTPEDWAAWRAKDR